MTDEDSEVRIVALQGQLARLRSAVGVFALLWLGTVAWLAVRPPSIPAVLSVERLEIVEPDGTPAVVMANSQRPTAATISGQVIVQAEARRGSPSIIFFDGKGDEVGGMQFSVRETADGYRATRHLSLDAYKQDQTIVLSHNQDQRGATSGLTISDRPPHSLLEVPVRLGLEPGASMEQVRTAIDALPEDDRAARRRELFGTARAFFGSVHSGEARLELRDGQGRVRIIIEAPQDGSPSIQILNEDGGVALRLPE